MTIQEQKRLRVLSLGAGVQSSTLALMMAHGEIEKPDFAMFADTGAEPKAVYLWLDWLETQLPFEVRRVSAGDLRERQLTVRVHREDGTKHVRNTIPAYVLNPDGSKGLLGRKCTTDFKIIPMERELRRALGMKKVRTKDVLVEQIVGISSDEAHRMKPSRKPWIKLRWPLCDLRMTRKDCIKWMKVHKYPEPPRSACLFCPFHSDHEWRNIQQNPIEFASVIDFERRLHRAVEQDAGFRGKVFLHNSCKPIDEVDFTESTDSHGQLDFWGNECEGMCGV